MTLSEMHVWFRQYAQQMGMQNVRALLPEQIDLLINTSITDTINQIIVQNIGVTNDRIITDNSKIGQINALKTLYTVKSYKIFDYSYSKLSEGTINLGDESGALLAWLKTSWNITFTDSERGLQSLINFTVGDGTNYTINTTGLAASVIVTKINEEIARQADGFNINLTIDGSSDPNWGNSIIVNGYADSDVTVALINHVDPSNVKHCDMTPSVGRFALSSDNIYKALLRCNNIDISYLYLVDFAIDYKVSASGMKTTDVVVNYDSGGFTTKLFPVRLIDDMYLADTLNDFILAPRLRSPILTVNANNYDLYFDKFIPVSGGGYTLDNGLVPYNLRISYIAKPNKVEYRLDKGLPTNIECNLPEYLHVDILKHAVDLYRASISGSLFSQQQQDQQQQREIARNTATPSNGYQNQ